MIEQVFKRCDSRRELIGDAVALVSRGQRIALATLVNVVGSAPYPLGSQMLICESGEFFGQITGGCAEQAIADHGVSAIQSGQSVTHRYGLDSPFFDIQLPCGSGIDVLIDVNQREDALRNIVDQIENGVPYEQTLDHGSGDSFTKVYLPTPRLLIVGQGPIVANLAGLANESGFDTCLVVQNQENKAALEKLGLQSTLVNDCAPLNQLVNQFTGVVSLFHEHDHELHLLSQAVKTDAFYIGALGSRQTHKVRMSRLKDLDCTADAISRVFGPVGVHINASTPAEIAISILAQAINELNKFYARTR